MSKVLRIENRIVTIGLDNGDIEEYDIGYFNYEPHVGDTVRIYHNENTTVIAGEETQPRTAKHKVNKLTYGLFGILLGWFGLNEFYAGYTVRGILSCIFCWTGIPEIVNLVKGIAALCRPADEDGNILV